MANNTSHLGSFGGLADQTAAFAKKGSPAKVLSKETAPINVSEPTGHGVATNLVKVTEVPVFPDPNKK